MPPPRALPKPHGASWGSLGASWGPLGASWKPLGAILRRLGAILGTNVSKSAEHVVSIISFGLQEPQGGNISLFWPLNKEFPC